MDLRLLNDYLRETFGCKVYKLALNAGFTCPNRDGTLGRGGCIFCSAGGSGEFAEDAAESITEQIEAGKARVARKIKDGSISPIFRPIPIPMLPLNICVSYTWKRFNTRTSR